MREMKRPAPGTSVPEISQDLTKKNKTTATVPVEILRDVQFNMIDVKLFQKNILDKSDLILLKSYSNNDEIIEILFELLRNKSEEHHTVFLDIIEEDYNWLRDKCEILLQKMRLESLKGSSCQLSNQIPETAGKKVSEQSSPDSIPLNDNNKDCGGPSSDANCCNLNESPKGKSDPKHVEAQKISQSMISVVRRNHRVVRGWTKLAHVLGMTGHVPVVRMRMIINGEDIDACIIHLLEEWQGRDPQNATLKKLISALREEEFNEVADELEDKFPA